MIKDIVLKIIEEKPNCCDDCIAKICDKRRQQVNKRCNKLVEKGFIFRKKNKCIVCENFKITNIIASSGINELNTLEEKKKEKRSTVLEKENFGRFNINFEFKWNSLFEDENLEFLFPIDLNKEAKKKHSSPSVYRWILINPEGKKLQDVYIGEASELTRRIYNYLKPGKSQKTNSRLNKLFTELLNLGYNISLQKLSFNPFYLGEYEINENSLENKLTRRFVEHMMASYYLNAGYNLINA
jgi:hypothetical protein